jgi:hypothetical protein
MPHVPEVVTLICIGGGLFALIALMPDFQGSRQKGWDKQEDDQ